MNLLLILFASDWVFLPIVGGRDFAEMHFQKVGYKYQHLGVSRILCLNKAEIHESHYC